MSLHKKNDLCGSRYAIDFKIQNLAENGSMHSLIFTFRLKFPVYKRKQ